MIYNGHFSEDAHGRENLVGTQEQHLKLNNFGSTKAFLINLFVPFRDLFVAPGAKFLKFFF